jgi:single-stranded-DNA-specific exonuclease
LYKNLAWAWVALKLIQALSKKYFQEKESKLYLQSCIDIAAIWTVADCMELKGENRIIVSQWLKQVKNSRSSGIKKLIEEKLNDELDADLFAFSIWPKLNAAWRLDTPYKAVNLLLNNSSSVLKTINEIEKLNEKRKYLTSEFVTDALWKVKPKDNILFYVSPAIEHWIIWIVAWRLTENFYKPCICLKDEWDKLVASCRSPEYFSIIEILERYKDYFLTFGWHKQAAGFSISRDKFSEFRAKILQEVNALDFSVYKKKIEVDKIIRLEDIWFSLLNKISKFKPFGIWNPKPLFLIEDLEYDVLEFLGNGKDHLRFTNRHWLKIFAFGFWEYYEDIKKAKNGISIVCDLSEDSWNGNKNILVKVVDVISG